MWELLISGIIIFVLLLIDVCIELGDDDNDDN